MRGIRHSRTNARVMGKQQYTSEQIIEALREKKGLVYLAADKLGCDPTTIYRRAGHVASVAQAIKDARGKLVDVAEERLWSAVEDREPWAISMVLKTLGKDRGYVERQEITGKDGQDIGIKVRAIDYRVAIAAIAAGSDENSDAPGEDESLSLRSSVG